MGDNAWTKVRYILSVDRNAVIVTTYTNGPNRAGPTQKQNGQYGMSCIHKDCAPCQGMRLVGDPQVSFLIVSRLVHNEETNVCTIS